MKLTAATNVHGELKTAPKNKAFFFLHLFQEYNYEHIQCVSKILSHVFELLSLKVTLDANTCTKHDNTLEISEAGVLTSKQCRMSI